MQEVDPGAHEILKLLPLVIIQGPEYMATEYLDQAGFGEENSDAFRIDCRFYNSFQPIIRQISDHLGFSRQASNIRELCENISEGSITPGSIILYNADFLLTIDGDSLALLCQLRQLTRNRTLNIMLTTQKSWFEFGPKFANIFPKIIDFPIPPVDATYDRLKGELNSSHCPPDFPAFMEFFKSIMKRQYNELDILVALTKKSHPVITNEGKSFKSMPVSRLSSKIKGSELTNITEKLIETLSQIEKFLLIASYLASQIPSKNDSKVFGLSNGRIMKTKKVEKPLKETKQKIINFERLLAIFYLVFPTEFECAPSRSAVMNGLQRLVSLRLILRIGPMIRLNAFKYRCNISHHHIRLLSSLTRFQYGKYLQKEI